LQIFEKVKQDEEVMREARKTFAKFQEDTLEYLQKMEAYETPPKSRSILERFVASLTV
jgi:hypothetical protein